MKAEQKEYSLNPATRFTYPATGSALSPVVLPETYNYIAAFLTLECNLHCSYCINRFSGPSSAVRQMSGAEWVTGLNRLVARNDLPLTFQGGEPTLHPDFFAIAGGVKPGLALDLLTNLETDLEIFMARMSARRFRREAPYASIRVSYHPESMIIEELSARVLVLLNAGYHIGIWGVEHPGHVDEIRRAREHCARRGIDFRTKEFLGEFKGKMFGNLFFPDACDRQAPRQVQCRTTELLIGPGGDVFRCHADLYEMRNPVGHILDPGFTIDDSFRPCDCYGFCNPCDVKLKTNRFQEFGHTSVDIIKK
jgi:hypothetical protein